MKFAITFSNIVDLVTCLGVVIAILEFRLSRKSILAAYERDKKQSIIEMFKEYEADFHKYNTIIYRHIRYKHT